MIYISSSLVLTDETATDPDLPVIGWHNLVTTTSITPDQENADHPAINLANPATNQFWQATSAVEQYIVIDIETVDQVDYLAVARHNFGTQQIAVSVEGIMADGSPADIVELVSPAIPADDTPIIFRFTPQSLPGIRLRMQAGLGIPEAGVIYVGRLLVMEQGVLETYTPLPYALEVNEVSGRSESGNYLGRIVTGSKRASTASFANLSASWFRTYLPDFLNAAVETPFFFAWQPDNYPAEVGYAWLDNDPKPALDIDGYVAIDFQMTGIA